MIAAAAAALALAAPSREGLVERWLRANPAHSAARLETAPRVALPAPANLDARARHELDIAGRYQLAKPSPASAATQPWWLRLLPWFADLWKRFWHTLFARVHVGKQQAASIGDVLLLLIGLILLFAVVRLVGNLQLARSDLRRSTESLTLAPNPLSLYRRACEAASRGEYGNAALLLFSATVALLDGRGAVEAGRSATVGDLRRELRAHNAALVEPFDAVTAPFVEKAYAERDVEQPQWNRARDAFDRLLKEGAAP